MGGKSKQARVKNNAKPSNSSRSAELLGNTLSPFVGFSVQSELKPFASSFSDNAVDCPDANIDPQLQLIIRKMSKKDPVTKVKALQEFIEEINAYDVEAVKVILPLWPKLYTNLANDVDHRVREGAQEVMNIIAEKCKKSVAPYLKQLVPIWLASSFDNYAPAASTASTSFKTTFANNANKVREVCIYCQNDIVDYTVRNLTFHTASTLSSSKNCTPEEAEQKYQRVVSCSLRTLAYFFEVTSDADIGKIQQPIQDLLANPKFWSFSKSKVIEVKASWFEVLCLLMQNISLETTLLKHKPQVVSASFQNIDESDPLIAPHVWVCILLVQSKYDDWYDIINMKKAVLPKLSSLLRNGCNKNANAICLNLLPFLSKLSQEALKETKLNDFQKQFFDDMKIALTTLEISSKSEYSAITKAYFECLRYVIQKINTTIQEKSADINIDTLKSFAKSLLSENIISLLTWCLASETKFVKTIIQQTSLLHAYWASHVKESDLYSELLDTFWSETIMPIMDGLVCRMDDEIFFDHVVVFCEELYFSCPRIENQKVQFNIEDMSGNANELNNIAKNNESGKNDSSTNVTTALKNSTSTAYIESNLKNLVLQLVRLCLMKSANESSSKYVFKIHKLIKMFHDADFYAQISEERTLLGTLDLFLNIMENLEVAACEDCIDIIFDILNNQTTEESLKFIQNKLLKIKNAAIQKPVLNRLLSHPLNNEPEVRTILSQPDTVNIITNLAKNVLEDDSKDSLNLLRKCFFQNDEGLIAIDSKTADSILKILAQPLTANADGKLDHLVDLCGSFISQSMPVICSEGNSSTGMQREIFLILFRFSIEHTPNDFISEDTLWEITTSWQDSLSSQDILADMPLFYQCKAIVMSCLQAKTMTIDLIETIADAVTQYVICSTEHIQDEKERFETIDLIVDEFFKDNEKDELYASTKRMQEFCLFLEALQGKVSVGWELNDDCMENMDMLMTFRQILLNTCIIFKLVSKPAKMARYCAIDGSYADEDLNESSDDFCDTKQFVLKQWSSNLYNVTLRCISVASVGDALLNLLSQIDENLETTIVQLSEKVKMLFRQGNVEFLTNLKDRMLAQAASEVNGEATRFLLYLVNINQYEQFEENASILLWEDLSEHLVTNNALKAYANTLQYILPNLTSKAITMHMPIMRTNPSAIWIKAAVFRCLIENNFNSDYNEKADHNIIAHALKFLLEVSEKQLANKESLLYNVEIQKQPFESVTDVVEFIKVLKEVIQKFPYELTIKNWDAIRIGLSSWVLSVSKSIEHIKNPQVALFLAAVFELFAAFGNFINNEKQKSSTEFLNNIIDEWENLFAREVNIVLFKAYYTLIEAQENCDSFSVCYNKVLEVIAPAMELINYGAVFNFYKTSTKITSDNVLNFLLKNLSNSLHCVRTVCVHIIKLMTQFYVSLDIETYENKIENLNINTEVGDWHFLSKFEDYIGRYEIPICKYLDEFSFKLTEVAELKPIDRNEALAYFFLWDCIIYTCANSPITLRSLYTSWLHEKRYEENLLHFLFRAMPAEILKNHDSKIMMTDAFKGLTFKQIQDQNLAVEKYACHLYTEVLRKLPAVVRKWWNTCQSRQKTFVDKLTTNFVSPIICSEELKAIGNKKERHENMQVTVHTSTREVLAVYSIDEARMELVITLAPNYPLGSVKVDSGKQIGGRLSSRNTGMQLTIFLTHQNGSIFDGLTLWKNNLDKKFEGVEECYVCYTVIHQDTCQLPKLTCKTCRKKFHGPCLYKWFTTSSKSTCPICRNIF